MSSINTDCQPSASLAIIDKDLCLVNLVVLNESFNNVHDKPSNSFSDIELSPNNAKLIYYIFIIDIMISLISNADIKAQLSLNVISPSLDHYDGLDGVASSPCVAFFFLMN